MKELSLFSGAGGGLLGTKLLGWEHCGYVEFSKYCQRVIRARIDDGILDDAPIFGDIRTFLSEGYAESYQGMVDVVTGGFPCQPFSVAGKQTGGDDSRNMWPETLAVLRAVRPRYAYLENVPGLLTHQYARRIFGDLAESGFDAQWRVLSAGECGAPHKRDRIWIYCHANGEGESVSSIHDEACELPEDASNTIDSGRRSIFQHVTGAASSAATNIGGDGEAQSLADTNDTNGRRRTQQGQSRDREPNLHGKDREAVADSERIRLEGQQQSRAAERTIDGPSDGSNPRWWETEPDVGRVVDGVASRVDRLKALGNGQVPAVAATAWNLLRGATR
jgi:DNA (cytosine-5)-methyltransferase 1